MPARFRLSAARGMVGLMCASHLSLEGCHHFLPVAVPLLITALNVDYTQIGTLALLGLGVTAGAQPLFGWLADRWRPAWIVPLSILWVGLCMSLTGIVPSYLLLSVVIVGAGLGSAAYHPAAAAMTMRFAGPRPGTMFAIFSLGGTLGVALSPLLINYLIGDLGLRVTLLYAPLGIGLAFMIHRGFGRLIPRAETGHGPVSHTRYRQTGPPAKSALVLLGLLVMATMTRSWVHGALSTYLPVWALETWGSTTLGGELLATFALMAAAGNFVGGLAADRWSGWRVLAVSLLLMAAALGGLFAAPVWALWPLLSLLGLAQGATIAVPMLMGRQVMPERSSLVAALVMGIGWTPSGIGAWLTGRMADQWGIHDALTVLPFLPALGVCLILLFAVLDHRWTVPAPVPAASAGG